MKWEKPSGVVVETNDSAETKAYAIKLGWKEVKKSKPKPKAKS